MRHVPFGYFCVSEFDSLCNHKKHTPTKSRKPQILVFSLVFFIKKSKEYTKRQMISLEVNITI